MHNSCQNNSYVQHGVTVTVTDEFIAGDETHTMAEISFDTSAKGKPQMTAQHFTKEVPHEARFSEYCNVSLKLISDPI